MSALTEEYVRRLPKAELHLHLEGSITPSLFLELSQKYQTEFQDLSAEQLLDRVFQYGSLADFLRAYKVVCEHLREPVDYLRILEALTEYFLSENIQYAEVIYAPSIPWRFGRSGENVLAALVERSEELYARHGIRIGWILDCVRQWGRRPAQRTAELACEFQSRGVVAIGLGGDENSLPLEEYREVFSWAKAHQLYVHVHAGEVGEPEQVWGAVRVLGANRIGHGIHAARDAQLMEYLREHAIGLDVCLTSNLKTQAWTALSAHPFQLLYKRGVPVTLNTDDPGLFRTSLTLEYMKAHRFLGLGKDDVHHLILQSLRSSFLPYHGKMALMQRFQDAIHRLDSEPGA